MVQMVRILNLQVLLIGQLVGLVRGRLGLRQLVVVLVVVLGVLLMVVLVVVTEVQMDQMVLEYHLELVKEAPQESGMKLEEHYSLAEVEEALVQVVLELRVLEVLVVEETEEKVQ
jgi:hypothetical protein